jgi:glycosyltransferase involved in cell wall biosynthesis
VAYYVPPAGGPAVQRILQFIEYLGDAGWAPEVLTVEEGAYPNRDPSLLRAIPDAVTVHRTAAFDPLALYQRLNGGDGLPAGSLGRSASLMERAARWIRANVFIPDARVGWWPFAHVRGKELLDSGRFDAILSSGAPHSVHLAGRSLARATELPWVADLHDPWTDISYYNDFPHTAWARKLDERLERSVLSDAHVVTTVSPSWAELFRSKVDGHYAVVENGFDARDFALVHPDGPTVSEGSALAEVHGPSAEAPAERSFVLAHVGKLYASRNPTAVWDAIAALDEEGAIPDLTIRLIGTVDPAVTRAIADRGLEHRVDRVPFIPHAEAIREMAAASLLLLVIEPFAQARGMITSKLYEYLASGRPVIGVGPPDGDAAALLDDHDAGQVVDWNDARSAKEMIRSHYDAWTEGPPAPGADWDDIQDRNRETQAHRMADALTHACRVRWPAAE